MPAANSKWDYGMCRFLPAFPAVMATVIIAPCNVATEHSTAWKKCFSLCNGTLHECRTNARRCTKDSSQWISTKVIIDMQSVIHLLSCIAQNDNFADKVDFPKSGHICMINFVYNVIHTAVLRLRDTAGMPISTRKNVLSTVSMLCWLEWN